MRIFAVASPGLEPVVAAEVRALPGASGVRELPGGVEAEGDRALVWRANLRLRTATRMLVRVGEARAKDFAKLRAGVARLGWHAFAARPPRVEVSASAKKSRLYHTGAIAERVVGGIADAYGGAAAAADAPVLDVLVRGEDDVFTVSVDSSGELLHRRGWRVDTAKASLRETLAAGMLTLAGWTPGEPLVDPMCGAGTIVVEAALAALGRPPGAARTFAFEAWSGFDRAAYEAVRAEAGAPVATSILGNERDLATFTLARRNVERAAVAAQVTLVHGDAAALALPGPPGLILANPPYGKRVSAGPGAAALRALAQLAARHPGWRLAVLLPDDREALRAVAPRPPRTRHALDNGGLRVFLNVW